MSCGVLASAALLGFVTATAAEESAPPGRTIGYAITDVKWSIHETEGAKDECPQGLNTVGPREQYKVLFPEDGTKRTLAETQLALAAQIWWPTMEEDEFPLKEAGGKVAIGLDLDGKTDAADFTSPDGMPGVDNQLFRAIGCINSYRTGNAITKFDDDFYKRNRINRMMIVLTDVDSLIDDDDVTITTYRGRDPLITGGSDKGFVPGSTQRLDLRWGKELIHSAKAKIADGVLTTSPLEFIVPHDRGGELPLYWLRDAQFKLSLTPQRAEGVVGGYADLEHLYRTRNRQWSPHHLSYGHQLPTSWYRTLRRLADGFPDPATGQNTALSAAMDVKLIQVHVLREGTLKEVQSVHIPGDAGSR